MPAATTAERNTALAPIMELRQQISRHGDEFAAALPSHIKFDHFQRAAITAVQNEPRLLTCERRSLFNALMRCAQDGLIPDGRQAALVIFKSRERGLQAQYMPMVAGIRKLVQQSGEISRFEQQVVYERDEFEFELGDAAHIRHKPALAQRGSPVLVYSIAQFRDGSVSREVMTVEEIEQVRAVSRAKDDGPWTKWWGEMARKTVAKRHAKSLPMANDVDAMLRRDDAAEGLTSLAGLPALPPPPRGLADQFDRLADGGDPGTGRRRGRPTAEEVKERKRQQAQQPLDETPGAEEAEATDIDAETGEVLETRDEPPADAGALPPEDTSQDALPLGGAHADPDYQQGVADARADRRSCLNRDIKEDARRLARWQAGYESVKGYRA